MRSRPTTAHQNGAVVAHAGRPLWTDWLAGAVICICEAMGANACRVSALTAAGVAPLTVTNASAGNAKGWMVSSCSRRLRAGRHDIRAR